LTVQITRITATPPDRLGVPILLATFDCEIPNATLHNCKLFERADGECFALAPNGLKFRNSAVSLRASITEAALDALEEIETK
jgi:hypothetical protein